MSSARAAARPSACRARGLRDGDDRSPHRCRLEHGQHQLRRLVQKSTGDLQVYQSCELGVWFDFMLDFDTYIASIPDGNGEAIFQGTLSNQLEVPQNLTVSLTTPSVGRPNSWSRAKRTTTRTASAVSLGVGEAIGVTLKVTTDGTVRIGEGGLARPVSDDHRLRELPRSSTAVRPSCLSTTTGYRRPTSCRSLDALARPTRSTITGTCARPRPEPTVEG